MIEGVEILGGYPGWRSALTHRHPVRRLTNPYRKNAIK
jgi:hypothetical protein